MNKRIVLLGYMASGKSTIAKKLAENINYKVIDLDEYIEKQTGLKVSDLFKQKGELYFRRLETDFLKEILNKNQNIVIAVGGGTPCYGSNMSVINQLSKSIYLNLPLKVLVSRLKHEKQSRPLIAHLNDDELTEFVAKHLFERQVFYNQAQTIINTANLSIEEICNKIKLSLN